jgi:hypothetical protein
VPDNRGHLHPHGLSRIWGIFNNRIVSVVDGLVETELAACHRFFIIRLDIFDVCKLAARILYYFRSAIHVTIICTQLHQTASHIPNSTKAKLTVSIPPFFASAVGQASIWKELTFSVPTLAALAELAAMRLVNCSAEDCELSSEALAILSVTRERGIIELKSNNTEFESSQRMLAVYAEKTTDTHVMFRSREEPEITVRFLEGFRELCDAGMVMHQVAGEFSLTVRGFDKAKSINADDIATYIDQGDVLTFK